MARFIVTHFSDGDVTHDQFVEIAKKVGASLAPGAEWLNAWWFPATGKLLCEWEAPDEDAIRVSLGPALDTFPLETIEDVHFADPQRYM